MPYAYSEQNIQKCRKKFSMVHRFLHQIPKPKELVMHQPGINDVKKVTSLVEQAIRDAATTFQPQIRHPERSSRTTTISTDQREYTIDAPPPCRTLHTSPGAREQEHHWHRRLQRE
jgi:hypothetical protein